MITALISRLVILAFGTLYPAYASYKAVRTKDVKEYVKWMMYWIVFALFTFAETFTDVFFSFWFPFYYELKIGIVFWLLSPATKGSSFLYRNFVHPALQKRETEIDEYLLSAKEKGYTTVMNIGSKGVSYATNVIVQTAIRGSGGIFEQIRKSYSLGDLGPKAPEFDQAIRPPGPDPDVTDGSPDSLQNIRSRKSPSYYPDTLMTRSEYYGGEMHSLRFQPFGEVRSTEDISTAGFALNEPVHPIEATGLALTRTASVPSGRGRGRGGRIAQTKRPPLAEDDMEEGEVQNSEESIPFFPCDPLEPEAPNHEVSSTPPEPVSLVKTNTEIFEKISEAVSRDPGSIIIMELPKETEEVPDLKTPEIVEDQVIVCEAKPVVEEKTEGSPEIEVSPEAEPEPEVRVEVEKLEESKGAEGAAETKEEASNLLRVEGSEFGSLSSLGSCADSFILEDYTSEPGALRRGKHRKRPAPAPPADSISDLVVAKTALKKVEDKKREKIVLDEPDYDPKETQKGALKVTQAILKSIRKEPVEEEASSTFSNPFSKLTRLFPGQKQAKKENEEQKEDIK